MCMTGQRAFSSGTSAGEVSNIWGANLLATNPGIRTGLDSSVTIIAGGGLDKQGFVFARTNFWCICGKFCVL
ncbi:hypothetical protein SERLADRAFT_468045 [Serpula lacrymans var. lacrymans S7.9]|uniref:Uncharacterized protein n=1 Tax=Serpula lacrymans var. lacrymans (strain S7.9) TaxID=578457 RepID=F8NX76_SERL9|nr:uncharacterized protein SERLADRAFT_468045 [Serpula lacrymans var. lacrymans S7.9]EGO24551.1 hypothetical protein SERLADRAFT_468045 [Serpula lacrymans var. lacrymans S7.9]